MGWSPPKPLGASVAEPARHTTPNPQEFLEREKKKTAQRLAEKQAKQAAQSGESADGKAAEVAA